MMAAVAQFSFVPVTETRELAGDLQALFADLDATLPFEQRVFLIREDQMRRLFPKKIVEYLRTKARDSETFTPPFPKPVRVACCARVAELRDDLRVS